MDIAQVIVEIAELEDYIAQNSASTEVWMQINVGGARENLDNHRAKLARMTAVDPRHAAAVDQAEAFLGGENTTIELFCQHCGLVVNFSVIQYRHAKALACANGHEIASRMTNFSAPNTASRRTGGTYGDSPLKGWGRE